MLHSNNDRIFDIIQRLTVDVAFTVSSVEGAVGEIQLLASTRSTRYFEVYEADCSRSDLFGKVELRIPAGTDPSTRRILLLELRKDNVIDRSEVLKRYGADPALEIPQPHEPSESPIYLVYTMTWGKLKLGLSRSGTEQLTDVVIDVD